MRHGVAFAVAGTLQPSDGLLIKDCNIHILAPLQEVVLDKADGTLDTSFALGISGHAEHRFKAGGYHIRCELLRHQVVSVVFAGEYLFVLVIDNFAGHAAKVLES